ncbi:MAG: hypothetical protein AABW81_01880 [Nanoarchaeota archaeon]
MKNNLIKKIGFGILSLAVLGNVACKKKEDIYGTPEYILKHPCKTYEISVEPNDGYDKYALIVKKEYSKKLGNIDYQDISIFLKKELNKGKELDIHDNITLPSYDCYKEK